MQLLISDANILIDLEEGDLLDVSFRLPYQFSVPDILFAEELEAQHAHLVTLGLGVRGLSSEAMRDAAELIRRSRGASRNDCFALALARQEKCPLLTGDRDLRALAEAERIPRDSATGSRLIRPVIPAAFGHRFHGHSAGAVGAKRRRWGIVTRRGLSASTGGPGACTWIRP
jgi:hypothetical protein